MRVLPFLFISLLILNSCTSIEPENEETQITLTTVDMSVTETYFNLNINKAEPGDTVIIYRNDFIIGKYPAQNGNKIITDTNLTQTKTYNYIALTKGKDIKSNKIAITTLAPTSHEFSWESWEIGEFLPQSVLRDVKIINDNDIWAVGAIYYEEYDSLGNRDYLPYNAIHWNGTTWEKYKISVLYHNYPIVEPLTSIFFTDLNHKMFSNGLPYLPSGNGWNLIHYWEMNILKEGDGDTERIWGTAPNNLFFAGRRGTIVHYNGANWTKIESGTSETIQDIWGTGSNIYCVASNTDLIAETSVLKVNTTGVEKITNEGLPWMLSSIWFNKVIEGGYIAGDGVYKYKNGKWAEETSFNYYAWDKIRGQANNDIVVSGSGGHIAHFNGIDWKDYTNQPLEGFYGRLFSVDIKGNTICAVGWDGAYAKIIIGKR